MPLLRAVLTAKAKEGVALHMLLHEFQEATFSPLEFKKMGYGTLEQYVRDCPELCRVQRAPEGYLVVKGIASEEDAHIFRLVVGQNKKSKKGKKTMPPHLKRTASHFTGGKNNFNFRSKSTFMGNNNNIPRPALLNGPNTFNSGGFRKYAAPSPRPAGGDVRNNNLAPRYQNKAQVKNLFTNNNNSAARKPLSSNFIPSTKDSKDLQMTIHNNKPTNKTTHFSSTSDSYESTSTGNATATKTQLTPQLINTMGQRLRHLLSDKPNGLWATRLQPEYKRKYKDTLPDDFREIIKEHYAFVRIDSPMANLEILYLKEETSPAASEQAERKVEVKPEAKKSPPRKVHNHVETNGLPRENYVHNSMRQTNVAPQQNGNDSQDSAPMKTSNDLNGHQQTNGHAANPPKMAQTSQKPNSPRMNSFNIPLPDLPEVGSQVRVYVCHIDDLNRFFVQFADSPIEDLVNEMQTYYDNSSNCTDIDKPRLNDFCAARYSSDQVWCRAKILTVKDQKNSVNTSYGCKLIFVDYGNEEYKVSTELKCLTDEFSRLPSQGILCCLHNLNPMKEGAGWSEKVTNLFREMTENVALTLVVKERSVSALSVDLIDAHGQSVAAYFCTSKIAKLSESSDNSALKARPVSPSISKHNPEYVVVPENVDYIDVSVTFINSANDVYIILIAKENTEQLEALEEEMNSYYKKNTDVGAKTLEVGGYYAVLYREDWVRVKLISVQGSEYEVFLLDQGNKTTVAHEELKELSASFYKTPFQAIPCVLANVPVSYDPDVLQYLTDNTLDKDMIGFIVERPTEAGRKMTIELYDTNESHDVNINNEIKEKIDNEKNLAPKLPDDIGVLCSAYVVHISTNGDVYIQIHGAGTEKLEILMNDMASHFTQTRAFEIMQRPEVGQICCAKFCEDGNWYRARVTKVMQSEHKVEVEFIDYGNREIIRSLFIRNPDAVNKQVISLPPQAVKCRLADCSDLNLTEDTYKKMNDYAQQVLDGVYVRVEEYRDSTPIISIQVPSEAEDVEPVDFVEMYQQYAAGAGDNHTENGTDDDSVFDSQSLPATANTSFEAISIAGDGGSFCTINPIPSSKSSNTLLNEYDIIDNVPIQKMALRSESPAMVFSDTWGLPKLILTNQWRVIEGVIVDTHHPYKFSFVPFDMWEKLETMHEAMKEYYQHSRYDENFAICEGDICAAFHSKDQVWYRAVVVQAYEDQVVLKYLDFSTTAELEPAQNIRALAVQFKELPFLSVRCSLYGVEPVDKGTTWDMASGDVFNEMVMNDTFQVEVMEMAEGAHMSKPLEVCLYGAKEEEDLKPFCVNERLVSLGHARRKR